MWDSIHAGGGALSIVTSVLAVLSVVIAAVTVAAVLADRRSRSQTAISWVLLIVIAPLVGAIVYWVFGRTWLSRRRERAYREVAEERAELRRRADASGRALVRAAARDAVASALVEGERRLAVQAASISGEYPVGGNEIEIFDEADELFERLARDIDAAKHHVHVLFYIALDDEASRPVFVALERAAARGVRCRLLLDGFGSRPFLLGAMAARLAAAGVQVVEALPVGLVRSKVSRIDLRNHRKIVVIDGLIGYIGSHNLAARDFKVKARYAPWIDATVRVCGPVATDLQKIFAEDWYLETDEALWDLVVEGPVALASPAVAQVLATGPTTYESAMPQMILSMVHMAEEEVVLTTPYFVPDEPTLAALLVAARRGVRTVLVVPERVDSWPVALASRKFFQRLLEAGVEIWQYRGGLLHTKTVVIDGRTSMITSANLDRRSFELNLEASLVVYDDATSAALRRLQDGYLARSTRIDPEAWYARPAWKRAIENGVGLLSPIL